MNFKRHRKPEDNYTYNIDDNFNDVSEDSSVINTHYVDVNSNIDDFKISTMVNVFELYVLDKSKNIVPKYNISAMSSADYSDKIQILLNELEGEYLDNRIAEREKLDLSKGTIVLYTSSEDYTDLNVGLVDSVTINNDIEPLWSQVGLYDISSVSIQSINDIMYGDSNQYNYLYNKIHTKNIVGVFDQIEDGTSIDNLTDLLNKLEDVLHSSYYLNTDSIKDNNTSDAEEVTEDEDSDTYVNVTKAVNEIMKPTRIDVKDNNPSEDDNDKEDYDNDSNSLPIDIEDISRVVSSEVKIATSYMSRKLDLYSFVNNINDKSRDDIISELNVILNYLTNRINSVKVGTPVWHTYIRDIRNVSVLMSSLSNIK